MPKKKDDENKVLPTNLEIKNNEDENKVLPSAPTTPDQNNEDTKEDKDENKNTNVDDTKKDEVKTYVLKAICSFSDKYDENVKYKSGDELVLSDIDRINDLIQRKLAILK